MCKLILHITWAFQFVKIAPVWSILFKNVYQSIQLVAIIFRHFFLRNTHPQSSIRMYLNRQLVSLCLFNWLVTQVLALRWIDFRWKLRYDHMQYESHMNKRPLIAQWVSVRLLILLKESSHSLARSLKKK